MNRLFIGINIVLAGFLTGCAGGSVAATPTPVVLAPTSHPYFAEQTATVLPTLVPTLSGPSEELMALANATLTAAAAPPDGATATPEPVTPLPEGGSQDEPTAEPMAVDMTATPLPTAVFSGLPQVHPIYRAVYFRSGPGTNYDILRFLREGESVLVIAKDREPGLWYNVELENGVRGWVAMSVSEPVLEAAMADLPVAATIPPVPTSTSAP